MSGVASLPTLLADIGGTFARFSLAHDNAIERLPVIAVADHPDVETGIDAALGRRAGPHPVAAIFAVAGPVDGGRMHLTNAPWEIDASRIAARFGFRRVRLVNDFAAAAWSLPALSDRDLVALGGSVGDARGPRVVLGPGTGLGAAAWLPDAGGIVISGEGGHASLAAADAREDAVLARLRARFGHVSAERALSGPGLVNLFDAIAALDDIAAPVRTAPEISAAALAGTCPTSRAALDMFCAMLGDFAGDLALTFGARGGIYVGGGIAPRIAEYLARSAFRDRLAAKGRMRSWIEAIPTCLIVHPEPAILGLAHLARRPECKQDG